MTRLQKNNYFRYLPLTFFAVFCVLLSQLHCISEGLEEHSHPGQQSHHHHHENHGKHSHDNDKSSPDHDELDACCQNSQAVQISDSNKKFNNYELNYITNSFVYSVMYETAQNRKTDRYDLYESGHFKSTFVDSLSIVPNAPPLNS